MDDAPTQEDLLRAIFQPSVIPEAERDGFESLRRMTVRLSKLREAYERGQSTKAMGYLDQRTKLKIDADLYIPVEDDRLLWNSKVHRLDYMMTVSDGIGLWAAIPNVPSNHNFMFNMDLKAPYREFKAKYGKLGFDPKGRMLYIGKCRNEDVWLAMAPLKFDDELPAGYVTGDSRLTTRQYRMLVMFLAKALMSIRDRGFTCDDPYGVALTGKDADFDFYTNVM